MIGVAVRAGLLLVAIAPSAIAQQRDTTTYADAATAELVALARLRHQRQDSLVRDYRALVTTRVDASVGRSRFARLLPLIAHETAARVTWRRPNDLQLEILGVRQRSVFPGTRAEIAYDRPWFVPRALGDSIHLMGLPETAALHPLADGAEHYYRYAISDSVILSLPGRTVRAIGIRVEPKELGASMVAGDMWIDAESADVVRLMVLFLGEYLWDVPGPNATAEDSADTRRGNRWAQRILTVQADLEYSLHENRYWMPYRQLLVLTVEVDFLIRGALPVRFVTTFRDYEINVTPEFVFHVPADVLGESTRAKTACRDSTEETSFEQEPRCPAGLGRSELRHRFGYHRAGLWASGRWEIAIPPEESLAGYRWRDSLQLGIGEADAERIRETVARLAALAEDLPGEWVGRRRYGLAWDQLADILRFNRVQGVSVGLGYEWRPGPDFTALRGIARFGTADRRLTGSLLWRREGPAGALEITAFRSVLEAEPWSAGQSVGNSLNGIFAGHDDADYYLGLGGGVSYNPFVGRLRDTEFAVSFERHRSMLARTGSSLNDALGGSGVLGPNPPVLEGDFVRARIEPRTRFGGVRLRAGIEALAGGQAAGGRVWATARIGFAVAGRTGAVSLKTGHTVGDVIPQLRFRVGGPQTVRGHGYGALVGRGFWSAQLDLAVSRRLLAAPVVFVDAGNTFDARERFDVDDTLIGVGVGLSFLKGWMRFNLAKGLNPSRDVRFDLLFGAPR